MRKLLAYSSTTNWGLEARATARVAPTIYEEANLRFVVEPQCIEALLKGSGHAILFVKMEMESELHAPSNQFMRNPFQTDLDSRCQVI